MATTTRQKPRAAKAPVSPIGTALATGWRYTVTCGGAALNSQPVKLTEMLGLVKGAAMGTAITKSGKSKITIDCFVALKPAGKTISPMH